MSGEKHLINLFSQSLYILKVLQNFNEAGT